MKCTTCLGNGAGGAFLHVKYGHTRAHTQRTHTHIGALGKMPTDCQPPLQRRGALRPREEPPHTLRPSIRARAEESPDAPGRAHRGYAGVRATESGAEKLQRPRPHVEADATFQVGRRRGATRGHTAGPGGWQWTLELDTHSLLMG